MLKGGSQTSTLYGNQSAANAGTDKIKSPVDSMAVFAMRFMSLSPTRSAAQRDGRPRLAAIVKPATGIVKSEKLRSGIAKSDSFRAP